MTERWPQTGLMRLVAWKTPRVTSSRAAEAALHGAPNAFGASEDLERLTADLGHDGRIVIDRTLERSTDRLVVFAITSSDFADVAPAIEAACLERGLVLFDPQIGRLVVPRRPGAPLWPQKQSPAVAAIRSAAAMARPTGDADRDIETLDRAVQTSLGAVATIGDQRYRLVDLPFPLPAELHYLVPAVYPLERWTERKIMSTMSRLGAPRPETRRAAAHSLGALPARADIDEALATCLESDSDLSAKAECLLGLAIHQAHPVGSIVTAAEAIVEEARSPNQPWSEDAAAMAVLAALVAAHGLRDRQLWARIDAAILRLPALGIGSSRVGALTDLSSSS